MSFWSLHDAMTEGRKWALEQGRVDGSYRDLVARVADNLAERASMGRIDENLDYVWLVDAFVALHSTSPSSRERHYLRGRIDEYCSQNAVPSAVAASARAKALASIPASSPVPVESLLDEDDLAIIAEDSDPAKRYDCQGDGCGYVECVCHPAWGEPSPASSRPAFLERPVGEYPPVMDDLRDEPDPAKRQEG